MYGIYEILSLSFIFTVVSPVTKRSQRSHTIAEDASQERTTSHSLLTILKTINTVSQPSSVPKSETKAMLSSVTQQATYDYTRDTSASHHAAINFTFPELTVIPELSFNVQMILNTIKMKMFEPQIDTHTFKTEDFIAGIPDFREMIHDRSELAISTLINDEYIAQTDCNGCFKEIRLCGYPPYSNRIACLNQNFTGDPLANCEKPIMQIVFCVFVGITATAIIIINGLIALVFVKNRGMRTPYDFIKVSLSAADAMIGFLMFTTVIPNVFWMRNLSEEEVIQYVQDDINSPNAVLVGSTLTVSVQSSLLHLCFISIERFLAITYSFWYRTRENKTVLLILLGIWIVSIVSAFTPALVQSFFEYEFQPALLIHLLTMKPAIKKQGSVNYKAMYYVLVALVLPFLTMVSFCVFTAIATRRKMKRSALLFGQKQSDTTKMASAYNLSNRGRVILTVCKPKQKRQMHPEISISITILIMVFAFTVTLQPFSIVVGLFEERALNCSNYDLPYAVTFYFCLFNSLVNGIIYSARDPKFRAGVKNIFTEFIKRNRRLKLVKPRALPFQSKISGL